MDYRYNRHLTCAFSLLLLWSLTASAAFAQVTLNSLPTWTGNTRFATSAVSEVRHPSLSLNGFNCGSACNKGYGLKQILEQVPGLSSGTPLRDVYNRLVTLHDDAIVNTPTTRSQVNQNVEIMQARAFVALATYVLAYNSQSIAGLPTHSTAAGLLKTALTTSTAWEPKRTYNDEGDDGVKWAAALSGIARTIDLYLALENAYCYYGLQGDATAQAECNGTTSNRLLSQTQKNQLFQRLAYSIDEVEYLGGPGWGAILGIPTVSGYDAQPGNHPLKVQSAIGLASMVANDHMGVATTFYRGYVQRAMNASLRTAGTERHYYFNYQTDDGKRFWAEGPYYFRYALEETVPFWHAIRVNNMLGYHPSFTAPDPFNTTQFTRPLEWLADIATPEGFTPPLDDSNKYPLNVAPILRWTSTYGTAVIGQKFAWIGDRPGIGFGSDLNLLLVEIAIPRLGVGQGGTPVAVLGNTTSSQTGEGGEQVVIVRRETTAGACNLITNPGDCHYLLLNAESGDAYGRGEGHEQADQAQLLYYIEGTSFLMDSGYDQGNGLGNSTWNHYADHNVLMQALTGEGGLPPPIPIAAGRKNILVVNPGYLYRTAHGSIDAFHVAQNLPHFITQPNGQQWPADYYREVLFIGGLSPYLIDFNRGKHYLSYGTNPLGDRQFKVAYHVNSNTVLLNNFSSTGTQFIAWTNVGDSGRNLYLFPVSMEYPVRVSGSDILSASDTAREKNGNNVNIKRVDIQDFKMVGGKYRPYFSVASIIQARSSTPSYPPKLLWSSFPTDRYQGWVWKQDANTYDIFVGRSTGDTAPQLIAFNLRDADAGYPSFGFNLPANKSYGFARVQYNSSTGISQVLTNYLVDLVPTTTTYTSNTSVGSTNFPGDVMLANNVILTITGPVTFVPGATVLLGTNAQIVVNGSGKITAQGTSSSPIRFIRAGTSAWKEITLSAGGNVFDNVVFDGGTKTVEVVSLNNTFRNTRFKNGWRGISSNYVTGSTSTRSSFTLENCFVENNSTVGVVAYNSNPVIKRSTIQNNGEAGIYFFNATTSTFHRNVITGNGLAVATRGGVEMYNTSLSSGSDVSPYNRAYNRIVNNAHHEFQIEGTSSLYLGYTTGLWGINTVYDTGTKASGEKLIYAAAGTSVTAHNTYWKNQNIASNFQGVPSTAYAYPISYDSSFVAGAGLSAPVPLRVASMEEGIALHESAFSIDEGEMVEQASYAEKASLEMAVAALQGDEVLKQRMLEIRTLLAQHPTASENVQLLRELFLLLRIDATDRLGERAANKNVIAAFRNQLATLAQASGLTPEQRRALREAAEAALLLDVQDALWGERYEEANNLVQTYGALVQTADHIRILLLNQISLLEQQQRYREALALFALFKAIQPEEAANPDYTPGNYDIIEESLREKADVAGKGADEPVASKEMVVEEVEAKLEELPTTYALEAAYPNPFNPQTRIRFALPEAAPVRLVVYDVTGREVIRLVEGVLSAGYHEVSWDASGLPSGVYLYRIEADRFTKTRRMVLVR